MNPIEELIQKLNVTEHRLDALETLEMGPDIGPFNSITMADDSWIGIGAALERIVFDAAGDIAVMGASFSVGTLTPMGNFRVYDATNADVYIDGFADNATLHLRSGLDAGGSEESVIIYYDGAAGKWQFGKDAGNNFFIYSYATGHLPFKIQTDDDVILCDGGGFVGINEDTPLVMLDVAENKSTGFVARFTNAGNDVDRFGIIVQAGGTTTDVGTTHFYAAWDSPGAWTGTLKTVNGVFQLADLSDERLKTNIKDTKLIGLDIINGLQVRDYNWKATPDGPVMTSFIAQEAQEIYPDMVGPFPDGKLGISRAMLIPVLVKAMQEIDARLIQGGL